ncbi:MAG TPA: fibronectin type III domain-containing protein, partial [Chitinophaga sp.]|uniref:fibronectin type III domain-containing protein n=1 Tax=Chitinophaga sp. TaxID=1869181 RepID=UPI002CBF8876
KYEWVKSGSNTILSTTNTLTASSAGSYIVRVKATNNCFSGYSDTFRIVNTNGINGPDAISNLAVSSTTKIQATISWTDNPTPAFNEKYFEIYRATQAGGPYILVGKNNTNVVTFTDNGLIPNTSYFYRVRPVNDNAAGPLSAEVKAVTVQDSSAPTPPGNLVASNVTNNTVTLTWTAATDDAAVAGYEIFANGAFYVAAGNVTTFNVTGLTDGNWYNFTVKAKDVAGKYSTPSNQVTVKMKKGNLTAKYYTGTWTSLPNFTTLTPAQTGTAFVPDLTQVPAGATGYAYMWTGYIKIPSTGTYTFETVSDDGSKLYFNKTYTNTATSTVSNDGVHASQSKTGTVLANAGVYPITITYFQNTTTAGSTMQVYWTNTLGGISRQLIPADAFVDPNAVTGNPPTAPSGLTASTVNFSKIKLNWTDNSNNETGFEIYRSATSNGTYSVVTTTAANIATYTDTLLQASTTYYYKIRAIGTYGESAYTSTANATTAAKPLPPATPANLVTTAVSTQIVKLTWTDNATNETGYEVHRSLADSLHFNVIASLPPITSGQGAWSDSSLTANTVAYYKVRAVGDGGYSTFTKATYAKSLNNPPVIDSIASRTIRYGTTVNVPVNATDPDNDPITLSLYNAPAFVTLQQNGTTTYLNIAPTVAQQGTYNGIGVIAKDNNNGADTSFFNLEVNDNYPPVINPVTDSTADEGVQKVLKLSLTDQNPGNTFTWTALQLPPFVTLQSNNDTCLLTVNAGYKDAGTYIVKVQAQDNQGGIDTKQFTLTVNDNPSPNYTLLLNFKLNTDAPAPWNNIGGSVTNNLKDTTGQQTNVGLRFEESWWAAGVEGPQTGNNSGVYPDVVLKEYLYFGSLPGFFNGAPVMHGHLSGLETNRTYTLKFHAGSNWWAPQPDNGSTAFTVNGVTKTLYVQNNTTNRAIFENVTPDANGEIVFTLSIPTGGQVGYLNALEVNAGGSGPVTPNRPPVIAAISNQTMDAGTTLNVPVSATDPDNDALTYTGLNLPSFATIVQNPGDIHIALAPATNNAGQYNNIGIIATDTHGNKDTATFNLTVNTPASTGSYRLLLRIRHQTDAPSPWNDITGRTNANLKNDQGQITGVGLNFDEYWWATNGEGATTGNNSGVYPDAVMHDHLYFGSLPGFFNGSPTMTGHITGLETSKTYTIKFFSSSKWWAPQPDNGSTKYTINGVSQTLYVQNNTSNVVTYNNITPASNGEIAFILSIPQGGQVGYINAIEIVANSVAPLNNNKVMTTGSLTNLSDKSAVSTDKSANSTGSSMQVNTYPNPFADALAVDITLQKTTNLLIEITDMSGRKVYTEVRRDAPQGRNTVRINTQSSISTTGMYILKVTAATGETQSKVIMKQR